MLFRACNAMMDDTFRLSVPNVIGLIMFNIDIDGHKAPVTHKTYFMAYVIHQYLHILPMLIFKINRNSAGP